MNVLTTLISAGAIGFVTPITLSNPFAALSVCAGGVEVEVKEEGVKTAPAKSRDFSIELELKSGKTVRVRL